MLKKTFRAAPRTAKPETGGTASQSRRARIGTARPELEPDSRGGLFDDEQEDDEDDEDAPFEKYTTLDRSGSSDGDGPFSSRRAGFDR